MDDPIRMVDVIYREIPLLRQVSLDQVDERGGFVETSEPLPVGTLLQLTPTGGGGPPVLMRVTEVRERRKKMRTGEVPGMRVTVAEDSTRPWHTLVAGDDAPPAEGLSEAPTRIDIPSTNPQETIVDGAPPADMAAPAAAFAGEIHDDEAPQTDDETPQTDDETPQTDAEEGGRRRRKKGGKRRRRR